MPKLFEYQTSKGAPRDKVWVDPTQVDWVEYESANTCNLVMAGAKVEVIGKLAEICKRIEAECLVPR